MARLAALILGLAVVSACLGRIPATSYYRLAEPPCRLQGRAYPLSLGVMRLRADAPYQDNAMFYLPSPYEVGSYGHSRWEAQPADMVTERLRGFLRGCGLFESVGDCSIACPSALMLTGRLTRFAEVDGPEGTTAEIGLEVELSCTQGTRSVWQGEVSAGTPMTARGPEELARAMSESLEKALGQLVGRLQPVLAGVEGRGCREDGR